MMVIGCEPGAVGAMSTGSSPLDPIFWVLHPAFEKALHILELSPGYRDTYDFGWVNSTCTNKSGGALHDTLPFSGAYVAVWTTSAHTPAVLAGDTQQSTSRVRAHTGG